nr:hypothetical protein [Tanacetum cinerariifolium]
MRDDHMFITIKLVSRHQNTQQYSVILPVELTNEAIINSKSYKEYYAIASGAEPPKTKASVRKKQSSSNTTVPPPTKGKRLKISAKVDKYAKEKQPAKLSTAKGLTVLSEVALTEAEQIKLATKRSLTQTHISHASGSGVDKGTGIIPWVPDAPNYEFNDEKVSWKSSEDDDDNNDDEEKISEHDDDVDDQSDNDQKDQYNNDQDDHEDDDDQDVQVDDDDQDVQDDDDDRDDQDDDDDRDDQDNDDDEQTNSDNNGDDFVHPKFSTYDEEAKDEESFNPIVRTPSHDDKTNDEDNDEDSDGMNVEGDEGANEEDDADELYRDVNINLEGRDIQMADVQTTQVIEDTHVTLTPVNPEGQQQSSSVSCRFVSNMLKPSPDIGIDSIFDSTQWVDVPDTTAVEPPLLSATTLPPPTISIIPHVQQTPAPSPENVPSSSLQDLPNFGSLFEFDHRLKTLETNFSEFMQTNQFAEAVSSIPGIVDKTVNVVAKHKAFHLDKKKQNPNYYPTYNLYGFPLAFKILKSYPNSKKWCSKKDNVLPREHGQMLPSLVKNDYNGLLGSDSYLNLKLYATPVEQQTEWFKASIEYIDGLVDLDMNVFEDAIGGDVSNNSFDLNDNAVSGNGNNDVLLLEGGDGFVDSVGGDKNHECNQDQQDKHPSLAVVLHELRALRKEFTLVKVDDARIAKLERILNDNFIPCNDRSKGNHNAMNPGLTTSANHPLSTSSRHVVDNPEVACAGTRIHNPAKNNDSRNSNHNAVDTGLSCSANNHMLL